MPHHLRGQRGLQAGSGFPAAKAVQAAVDIPVFVKLTPEGGRIAQVARACFEAGIVSAGTTANRLAIPDFDVYQPEKGICRLQDEPTLACFSGPWIRPLALQGCV
jgi:dihydroorotate dehydrogenase